MVWGILAQIGPDTVPQSDWLIWEFVDEDNYEITVGRTTDNTFAIPKAYVSGCHFSISAEKDKNKYFLTDFSSNGTYLNDVRVGKGNKVEIKPVDRISLRFKTKVQAEFEFRLPEVAKTNFEDEGPSIKTQRKTANKLSNLHMAEDGHSNDTATTMRIAALERDNQLQEQRISTYITKLESSAREVSNLQRELHELREKVHEKDSALSEEKQNLAAVESVKVALEARCRSLDDSIAHFKSQAEIQREQLRQKEERASLANELQVKLETLQDELTHKKGQYESSCRVIEDLTTTLSRFKHEVEDAQRETKTYKEALGRLQEVLRKLEHKKDQLKSACRARDAEVAQYEASNAQMEWTLRHLGSQISEGQATAKSTVADIIGDLDSLRGRLLSMSSSMPSQHKHWQQEITSLLKSLPVASSHSYSPVSPDMATTPLIGAFTQVAGVGTPTPGGSRHPLTDCTQLHDDRNGDEEGLRVGAGGDDVMCTALNSAYSQGGDSDEEEGKERGRFQQPHQHGSNDKGVCANTGVVGGTQISSLPTTQSISHTAMGTLQNPSVSMTSAVRPPSSLANRQQSGYDTISSSIIEGDLEETVMEGVSKGRGGGPCTSDMPSRSDQKSDHSPSSPRCERKNAGDRRSQHDEEMLASPGDCKDYDVEDDDDGVPSVDRTMSGQGKKRPRWEIEGDDSSSDQMSESQLGSSGIDGLM